MVGGDDDDDDVVDDDDDDDGDGDDCNDGDRGRGWRGEDDPPVMSTVAKRMMTRKVMTHH